MKLARTIPARALAAAALAAVLGAPAAQAQTLPTAREVLDRYVQALGGRDAMTRHQFRRTVAEMQMPAMGMSMEMEVLQARPNKMVATMTIPGMGTMAYGFDGTTAWTNNPMQGPAVLEGKELEQRMREADFDSSVEYAKFFPTIEVMERTEMGGRPCIKLRFVTATGDELFQCFDTENGLLVGSVAKQATQMGEMEATTIFSDYKDFDGIKVPTRNVTTTMGQEMVLTVKSVEHTPIDAAKFELPAEIKALGQRPN